MSNENDDSQAGVGLSTAGGTGSTFYIRIPYGDYSTTATTVNPVNNTGNLVLGNYSYDNNASAWTYAQAQVQKQWPYVDQGDRQYWCQRCSAPRPAPVREVFEAPPGAGQVGQSNSHCGKCGAYLLIAHCLCGEPLHKDEDFCRACGGDTGTLLRGVNNLEPVPKEELEKRGNTEDEGPFRGVRET